MKWLENLVVRLAGHVDNQFDGLTNQKAFDRAHDAYVENDFKTALPAYEELAEKNHGRAAALAGEMHLFGKGTKINGAKAKKYFEIGAKAGDPDAAALLGMLLAAGMAGVKVDFLKARPLLEAAAQRGDAKALEMLEHVKGRQRGKRI